MAVTEEQKHVHEIIRREERKLADLINEIEVLHRNLGELQTSGDRITQQQGQTGAEAERLEQVLGRENDVVTKLEAELLYTRNG